MSKLEIILDSIEEFEQDMERMILASRVVYDANYHSHLMQKSGEIMRMVLQSDIEESNKIVLLSTLNVIFQRAIVEIKI